MAKNVQTMCKRNVKTWRRKESEVRAFVPKVTDDDQVPAFMTYSTDNFKQQGPVFESTGLLEITSHNPGCEPLSEA